MCTINAADVMSANVLRFMPIKSCRSMIRARMFMAFNYHFENWKSSQHIQITIHLQSLLDISLNALSYAMRFVLIENSFQVDGCAQNSYGNEI